MVRAYFNIHVYYKAASSSLCTLANDVPRLSANYSQYSLNFHLCLFQWRNFLFRWIDFRCWQLCCLYVWYAQIYISLHLYHKEGSTWGTPIPIIPYDTLFFQLVKPVLTQNYEKVKFQNFLNLCDFSGLNFNISVVNCGNNHNCSVSNSVATTRASATLIEVQIALKSFAKSLCKPSLLLVVLEQSSPVLHFLWHFSFYSLQIIPVIRIGMLSPENSSPLCT